MRFEWSGAIEFCSESHVQEKLRTVVSARSSRLGGSGSTVSVRGTARGGRARRSARFAGPAGGEVWVAAF